MRDRKNPVTWDCIVIGAGLAGLSCAIETAQGGLKTLVISGGMNALQFASGSIDFLGYDRRGRAITRPRDHIKTLIERKPFHPYRHIGGDAIVRSMERFREAVSLGGLELFGIPGENHFHLTALGELKPSWLSPVTSYNDRLLRAFLDHERVALLTFNGYRDYHPEMTAARLVKRPGWEGRITTGSVSLPYYTGTMKNLHEFRSVDLARVFDSERHLRRIASEINEAAGDARVVVLPSFIGIDSYARVHTILEEMTGRLICEIPVLPPSLQGIRMDNALKRRFAALGGELSSGDRAVGAETSGQKVTGVFTTSGGGVPLRSRYVVLTTGSFFSGGLRATSHEIQEPVLNLKVRSANRRSGWSSTEFFAREGHPFMEFGVETDNRFRAIGPDGRVITNLFCAGSVLCGYDPVREGSGGGVAVATGHAVARYILKRSGEEK